jgi:hypothetical protein
LAGEDQRPGRLKGWQPAERIPHRPEFRKLPAQIRIPRQALLQGGLLHAFQASVEVSGESFKQTGIEWHVGVHL